MSVFHKHEEQTFTLAGNHVVGLATESRTARRVEVWRTRMEAGAATPLHQHDHEEIVVVLTGRGRATVGDRTLPFGAGDTVLLPPGVPHQLFADEESEAIAAMPIGSRITTPDGEPLDLPWRR